MTDETLAAAILRDVPTALIRRVGSDEHTITVIALDDAVAALSRAMSDDLAERAGDVVKDLRLPWTIAENMQPLLPKAADLITALLARNAALRAERDALAAEVKQADAMLVAEANASLERLTRAERLEAALQWCSGSADFDEGGVAREGWLKLCAPLLKGEQP